MSEKSDPAVGAQAVTKSDTTILNNGCRALYIGVTGNVAVETTLDGAPVIFVAVPVGILPVSPVRVLSTGTTASSIVALW